MPFRFDNCLLRTRRECGNEATTGTAGRFAGAVARLIRNKSGAFAPMFAVGMTAIFTVGGIAIQYSSLQRDRSFLQSSIDEAVLAGAATKGNAADKKAAARKVLKANAKQRFKDEDLTFKFTVANGQVTGEASINPKDYFVPFLATIDKMTTTASAAYSDPVNIEVSMVLDFSDSMGVNGKLAEMKTTSASFLDKLVELQHYTQVKAALTPFAALVGIKLLREQVITNLIYADYDGNPNDAYYTGCTGDRKYPYNQDGSGVNSAVEDSKFGTNAGGFYKIYPEYCKTLFMDKKLIAQPLNNDIASIKSALAAMQVSALTHLSAGMDVGLQMLNPARPWEIGADYSSKKTQKYLVFLTDGAQSAPAYGPGNGAGTVAQGWKNLTSICNVAKEKNVTVMVIAYDIETGNAAQWVTGQEGKKLAECASSPDLYFAPGVASGELSAAFGKIYEHIAESVVRLTQ